MKLRIKSSLQKKADEGPQVFHKLQDWMDYCKRQGCIIKQVSDTWWNAILEDEMVGSYSFFSDGYQEGRFYPLT